MLRGRDRVVDVGHTASSIISVYIFIVNRDGIILSKVDSRYDYELSFLSSLRDNVIAVDYDCFGVCTFEINW